LTTEDASDRSRLDEGFSIQSKSDYLMELRDEWSGLPGSAIKVQDEDGEDLSADKKGKTKKRK